MLKRSATYSLIAVICGAYLVQMVVPSLQQQLFLPSFEYLKFSNEWYRLFTVALTHGGLLHLGFNMYSLMVLGNPLEAAFGKQKFLIVFFFSLLTGSLTSAYFASVYGASVGASGAIFGLFGAFIAMRNRINEGVRDIYVIVGLNFVFGFILLYSGVKVLKHRDNEDEPSGHHKMMSRIERFMPVTDQYDGHRFFTKINAKRVATPLFAALIAVELTDIVFAVDSVPAILAVSREPYIVIASNAFAILGLRALYFLLADAKDRFHYLSHALGAILIFVGVKMMVSHWWHMPTILSLSVIIAFLVGAITASIYKTNNK